MSQPRQEQEKIVVVTGASSGIGQACVRMFIHAGYRVLCTARKDQDLETLRGILPNPDDARRLDVTDETSILEFASYCKTLSGSPRFCGLVNNAGIAVPGPVEVLRPEDLRRQLEVNLIGQLSLSQALLPLLRQSKGRIINISSLSGRITFPFMGAYCASKYALEAISDALRVELWDSGVRIILIEPGRIRTRIFEKATGGLDHAESQADPEAVRHYREMFAGARNMVGAATSKGIEAEVVARKALKALETQRPKARYLVGADAYATVLAKSWLPDCILDLVVRLGFKASISGKTL